MADSFHRKQLRQVVGIKWPHRISNRNLYRMTGSQEISKTITERRWNLLGHILRLNADTPARKSMRYYFKQRTSQKFLGRDRTTIVTTINKDIKRSKEEISSFPVTPLISSVSLQNIASKARNRKLWAGIVKQVLYSAYSN